MALRGISRAHAMSAPLPFSRHALPYPSMGVSRRLLFDCWPFLLFIQPFLLWKYILYGDCNYKHIKIRQAEH